MAELYSLEFLCADVKGAEKLFREKVGFTTVATNGENVVLKQNKAILVLKPATCDSERDILQKSGTICNNVVFKVSQLQAAYDKATRAKARVIHQPQPLTDVGGTVNTFTIASPFPNVTHTVVSTTDYNGVYLPGYQQCANSIDTPSGISFVDHIAYACETGTSDDIVKWYEDKLGFAKFKLGADSDDLSVDLSDGPGGALKLLAMEYWRCSEKGVRSGGENDVKIVLVESLPNSGVSNQVSEFLDNNNGPGVQHVAFHTKDVVSTVTTLKKQGLTTIPIPLEYYSLLDKKSIVDQVSCDTKSLQENGVLLDSEFDDSSKRYLMQVFSTALFKKSTFFIEFIQRCGATGFGAGNITALFKALELQKASGQ